MENQELGNVIKEYRKAAKLTQKQFAEKLGKAESTVRMWELGKNTPLLETLGLISEVLNIPLSELLSKAGYIEKNEFNDEQLALVMGEMKKIPPYENKYLTLLENLHIELSDKLQKLSQLSNDPKKDENAKEIQTLSKEVDLILQECQRIVKKI